MVSVPIETILLSIWPESIVYALYGIAGWMLFRFSKQKQSRGLLFMSRGFLIYTIIQIAWTTIYWSFGGPFYFFSISSLQNAAAIQLFSLTSMSIWFGSVIILVLLTIYGANLVTRNESIKSIVNFQDNSIDAPVARNTMKSDTT